MVYLSISGKELKKLLIKLFGYEEVSQKGSHMKIKFLDGTSLIIPDHKQLKEGLLNALLTKVGEKVGKTKLEVFNNLFK